MPDFTITTSDGRKFRVTAPDRQTAMAALQGQLDGQASSQPQPEGDTSMGTAFNVGSLQAMDLGRTGVATANRALEDSFIGNTLNFVNDKVGNPVREAFGFDPVDRRANAVAAQDALDAEAARAQGATEDYIRESGFQNMMTSDIDGFGDLVRYTGQKVANTAPMMMGAIGSGGMVTYPLSVGELSQNLDEIEGISQEQKDNLALGGGAIMTALENLGLSKLLPKGSNGTIIGGIAEGLITEGTTEGLQELVAIGAEAVAGKEFAEGEIANRLREAAVAGAVVGGTVRGGTQTASNITGRIFNSDGTVVDPESLQGMERQAAASLAQRLRTIADQNGYDLRDVGNAGDAKQSLEAAHEAITGRLKTIASDPAVRRFLDPKQAETLDQLLDDYAAAQTALRQGRNKVKSEVTQENFDAIMRLLPPTQEAAEIANLLREGNVLTQLFKNGTRGGISQYTDTFNPFAAEDGTYDPTKAISRIANVGLAVGTGGGSLPAQIGVTVAGRGIDKLTGRRSAVDRFVRTNEGNETLPAPRGPSLVAARALEEQQRIEAEAQAAERNARLTEQERQLNLDLVRRGAPPAGDINNPDSQSPQFIVENATGLDRSGVARILRIMKANPNTQPAILRAIEGYEKSIAEGGRVPLMTPLIRAIKQFQNANPEYQGAPSAGPTPPTGGPTQPQPPQFGGQMTSPENYQRGIQDNINFRENLAAELQADESLTPVVKAQVATGLDALGMNLGSAPVESVQTIVQGLQDQGVPQDVIDTYVTPYADRVISQQARQPAQMNIPTAPQAGPDVQSDAPAQPPRPRFDQAAPQLYDDAYRGQHRAPSRTNEYGTSLDDPREMFGGDDIYTDNAISYFGHGDPAMDRESIRAINIARDNPDAEVTIYRAVPKNLEGTGINAGDWVTLSRRYAERHGERTLDGDYRIIEQKARAGDLFTDGDIHEWGYDPVTNTQPRINESRSAPALRSFENPLELPEADLGATRLPVSPTETEIQQMRDGSYKPKKKRTLVEAAQFMYDKWREATGRSAPFEYTPENIPVLADLMATEAYNALQSDANAIELALKEGISNDQIQEALGNAGRDGAVDNQSSAGRGDDGLYRRPSGSDSEAQSGETRLSRSPVAGILAQRITGSGNPAVSQRVANPPEVPEVKAFAKDIVEKIEVGKRGAKHENGIKDLTAVKQLADAMNITLMMFDSFSDMQAAIGGDVQNTTLGAFIPERRTAYAMNAGAIDGNGNEVSELQSFVTALHEVAHGIASDDISTGQFAGSYVSKPNYLKEGKRDYAAAYSLEHVVGHLVSDKSAKRNVILAEILHLQKNASFSQGGNSLPMRQGNAIRNSISAMRRSATRRGQDRASFDKQYRESLQEANDYFDYEVSIPELTVDPTFMYIYDPKTMKRVAPNTAALIKGLFDKANNPKIQFFSHPLAMVIAIVAAMLARQEMAAEEEEQQKRQMQAGLLTQQPTMGALSV